MRQADPIHSFTHSLSKHHMTPLWGFVLCSRDTWDSGSMFHGDWGYAGRSPEAPPNPCWLVIHQEMQLGEGDGCTSRNMSRNSSRNSRKSRVGIGVGRDFQAKGACLIERMKNGHSVE